MKNNGEKLRKKNWKCDSKELVKMPKLCMNEMEKNSSKWNDIDTSSTRASTCTLYNISYMYT